MMQGAAVRRVESKGEIAEGRRGGARAGRQTKVAPAAREKREPVIVRQRAMTVAHDDATTARREARRAKPAPSLRSASVSPAPGITDEDVRTYMPLVRQVVQRMVPRKPPEVAIEDLISWGVVGLLDAMRKYDHRREASFPTYAQYRIRGSILDYLRRCDWLPRSVRQRSHDVEAATTEIEHRLGRPATVEEVSEAMGISVEEYAQTVWSCGSATIVPTAELSFGRGEESLSGDEVLSDAGATGPMHDMLRKERLDILAKVIETLPEKERIVVSFYYFEGLTMREVADTLHLTEGRISQLHTQAMARLRRALAEGHSLADLLD